MIRVLFLQPLTATEVPIRDFDDIMRHWAFPTASQGPTRAWQTIRAHLVEFPFGMFGDIEQFLVGMSQPCLYSSGVGQQSFALLNSGRDAFLDALYNRRLGVHSQRRSHVDSVSLLLLGCTAFSWDYMAHWTTLLSIYNYQFGDWTIRSTFLASIRSCIFSYFKNPFSVHYKIVGKFIVSLR